MKRSIIILALAALVCAAPSCKKESKSQSFIPTDVVDKAQKNIEKGKAFIDSIAKKDSTIQVLPTGLAYKVIKEGEGARPTEDSKVVVNYTGKHMDGSVFDSSNGNPATFQLQGVVPGFSEGIAHMKKGSVYELYIPGKLGYGEQGQPMAGIEPNELLIFEVELVDFE